MIHETMKIAQEGSLEYARVTTYLWEDSPEIAIKKRALVLICPGGGYHRTSDREAEAVALKIMSMGHHAAVLRYSVAPARFLVALREVARSITLLRKKAEAWHIDENKIVVMGGRVICHAVIRMKKINIFILLIIIISGCTPPPISVSSGSGSGGGVAPSPKSIPDVSPERMFA